MKKEITIICAAYNEEKYIEEKIVSLLDISGSIASIILIDDASTDATLEICNKFSHYKNVMILKHKQNSGTFTIPYNNALEITKTPYVIFTSPDDIAHRGFLEEGVKTLNLFPHVNLFTAQPCFSNYESGAPFSNASILSGLKKTRYFSASEIISLIQQTHFWIPTHSSLFRTSAILKHNKFHTEVGPYSDWLLAYTIALESGIVVSPNNYNIMRLHPESYSNQSLKQKEKRTQFIEETVRIIKEQNNPAWVKSGICSFLFKAAPRLFLMKPSNWSFLPYMAKKVLSRRLFTMGNFKE